MSVKAVNQNLNLFPAVVLEVLVFWWVKVAYLSLLQQNYGFVLCDLDMHALLHRFHSCILPSVRLRLDGEIRSDCNCWKGLRLMGPIESENCGVCDKQTRCLIVSLNVLWRQCVSCSDCVLLMHKDQHSFSLWFVWLHMWCVCGGAKPMTCLTTEVMHAAGACLYLEMHQHVGNRQSDSSCCQLSKKNIFFTLYSRRWPCHLK